MSIMSQLVVWIERQRTRIKNRSKSIKINKGCNVTSNSFFEGNNVLGDNTYFRGSLGKGTYIGSDAHIPSKVGSFEGPLARALEAGLDPARIVNIKEI